ncbi:MAG: metallophosphoesterase family protein [Gemmataceae bacterium]|nr:metallophosphoesterase family protein [Gemmataceae bacterium]
MKAILSDIHANWEALQAVLQDAASHGAKEIYCLGDLVGYGPDPRKCVDLLINLEPTVAIRGNHDDALFTPPQGFHRAAERALRWTHDELALGGSEDVTRRREFLAGLPLKHQEGGLMFVHGSPRDPLNEYVFPAHAKDEAKMGVLFWLVKRCCFMGHTHVPGIFIEGDGFYNPDDLDGRYRLGGRKVLCNVGSVGQSRDDDKRASYVLLDDDMITFRRVEYDLDAMLRKVHRVAALDASAWH